MAPLIYIASVLISSGRRTNWGPKEWADRQRATVILVLQIHHNLDLCGMIERGVSGVALFLRSDNMRSLAIWMGHMMIWPLCPWPMTSFLTPYFFLLNIKDIKVAW